MAIALGILGWILFILTAILYWVGNRLNAAESNGLAAYGLALLFSDDFRAALASGFRRAAEEALAQRSPPESVAYALMQGVTQSAKRYYQPDAPVNSVEVATSALRALTPQAHT